MTIMSSIMQIVMLPILGLMQGAQPIMSYNYGAKYFDRVKSTFKLSILLCFSFAFFNVVGINVISRSIC